MAACDAREGSRERIAKWFGVSDRWIRLWLAKRKETGSFAALPQNPGRKPKLNERQMGQLQRLVKRRPDAALRDLKEGLEITIMDQALLRALNFTLRKVASGSRARARRRSRGAPSLA